MSNEAQTENHAQDAKRPIVDALVMFFRRNLFCRFDTHWGMQYDSGIANDIGRAGTCIDCGYRTEGIAWPRHDDSDLIDLLKKATKKTNET